MTSRLTNVIRVLAKHHLGGALVTFGFAHYLPVFSRKKGQLPPDLPKHLREAFEELGGAYIKLGQLLSMRPDLVPPQFCEEFSKLLDDVPPEPIETILETIEKEFKKPANTLFSHIDPRPIGSASVAQVYKARTKTGNAAAIKVQRPNIAAQFREDIEVMRFIAQKLSRAVPELNTTLIIDEFERYTKKELDFTIEAHNIDTIKQGNTLRNITIPRVYWETTTEKVLTLEYLDGKKVTQIQTPQPKIARELLDTFVQQVFEIGTFHADLHPGNILLMNQTHLGLLDFGIVGHLDQKTRDFGLALYTGIATGDDKTVSEVLLSFGLTSQNTNERMFSLDVKDALEKWQDSNPTKRRITHLFHELFNISSKHHIRLPRDIVLLAKGMVTVEATARQLDPKIDFMTHTEPKIVALLKKKKTSKKIITSFSKQAKEMAKTLASLPSDAQRALKSVEKGNVVLKLDDTKFRHIGKDINLSSNRLSYSLVAAALIVASALFINTGPKFADVSIISLFGLAFAAFFIGALIRSIMKEGKPKYDNHEGFKI
jgi:ubiquinone biosynthesis protein